ncbi:MAG TPA: DCC1-like thiol-disulfide oxidoreductase family protein [Phnomibacter sp.]|nr:DCC1-like thiol-disulfide oxidoreductase family protein [Phnomibacter sp.]
MKSNTNDAHYQLCYDHDCPLCVWYTGYFHQHGYLKKEEVVPFHACNAQSLQLLNSQKMTNEIPLIDHKTQQAFYGIDALLQVIAQKHPKAASLAGKGFAKKTIQLLYNFISYNRKVIVGKIPSMPHVSCDPSFHVFYRRIFIVVMTLLSLAILLAASFFAMPSNYSIAIVALQMATLSGSFLCMHKQGICSTTASLEIGGQMVMMLLLNSVGFFINAVAFHLFQNLYFSMAILSSWQMAFVLPQWYIRVQYTRYRVSLLA